MLHPPVPLLTAACILLLAPARISAQPPSCSAATTTIRNAADATALSPCATFTGTIELAPDDTAPDLTLPSLTTLSGSLLATSAPHLTTLSLPNLTTIHGYLFLDTLPALTTAHLPSLTTLTSSLRLVNLPLLTTLTLTSTLSSIPLGLTITATALSSLPNLSPSGPVAGITITSNPRLAEHTLTFPHLTSTRLLPAPIPAPILIERNGPGLALSLPLLTTAQSVSLANLSAIDLPRLEDAWEFVLRGNTFPSFSAPALRVVGNGTRGVAVRDNQGLTNLSLPSLVRTGALEVVGNSRLERFEMPRLEEAPVGVLLEGGFESVAFPALQSTGRFVLETTVRRFDCGPWREYRDEGVIKGGLTCRAGVDGGARAGLSAGVKAGIGAGVGGAVVVAAVLAGLWYSSVRRRRRRRREKGKGLRQEEMGHGEKPPGYDSLTQLPGENATGGKEAAQANEMEAANEVFELQADREWVELPGEQEGRK